MLVDSLQCIQIMNSSLLVVMIQIDILLALIIIVEWIIWFDVCYCLIQATVGLSAIERGIMNIMTIV